MRQRSKLFWPLAIFFAIFVLFLYGPISTIVVLSFQGEQGGLTFPMNGVSTHWFYALFQQQRVGDFKGSFLRSLGLGLIVMSICVTFGVMVGQAYRYRFKGASALFYLSVASLIVPNILISLGIGVLFDRMGWSLAWYTSGLAAHLTWTLPFAMLIMLAIFNRFNRSYEEAARDLGANGWTVLREVTLPLLAPGVVSAGLFAFLLSWGNFPLSLFTTGADSTLPEWLYAKMVSGYSPLVPTLGVLTVVGSATVIVIAVVVLRWFNRGHPTH